jgi:hypothetical protein
MRKRFPPAACSAGQELTERIRQGVGLETAADAAEVVTPEQVEDLKIPRSVACRSRGRLADTGVHAG